MNWIKNIKLTKERLAELKKQWEEAEDGQAIAVANLHEMEYLEGIEGKANMPTPEAHNEMYLERQGEYFKTGIACPKCGKEMSYRALMPCILTNPPQKYLVCKSCDTEATIYC